MHSKFSAHCICSRENGTQTQTHQSAYWPHMREMISIYKTAAKKTTTTVTVNCQYVRLSVWVSFGKNIQYEGKRTCEEGAIFGNVSTTRVGVQCVRVCVCFESMTLYKNVYLLGLLRCQAKDGRAVNDQHAARRAHHMCRVNRVAARASCVNLWGPA